VERALLQPQDGTNRLLSECCETFSAEAARPGACDADGRLIEAQEDETATNQPGTHDDIGQQAAAIAADLCALRETMARGSQESASSLATWFRNWLRIGDQHPQACPMICTLRAAISGSCFGAERAMR